MSVELHLRAGFYFFIVQLITFHRRQHSFNVNDAHISNNSLRYDAGSTQQLHRSTNIGSFYLSLRQNTEASV